MVFVLALLVSAVPTAIALAVAWDLRRVWHGCQEAFDVTDDYLSALSERIDDLVLADLEREL